MDKMRNTVSVGIASALLLCSVSAFLGGKSKAQTPPANTKREPVIVELFTSEGCSSCPPADALLARLEDQQPIGGAEILALEEHVDYWNQQGWFDPFSGSEWTLRQQGYVTAFKGDSPYTPQMVVDGRSQFIGGRIGEVMAAIGAASRSPKTEVVIAPVILGQSRAPQFAVSVPKETGETDGDTAEVWLAVTETGLHSDVKRGENAGKDLHHAAIVRWMHKAGVVDKKKTPPSFTGNASVKLNPQWSVENLRVVAFVQEKNSRHILGAASLKMPH